MHYQFFNDNEATKQQTDQCKQPGGRKKLGYDFKDFKFSYDTSKDSASDASASLASQRNQPEQPEQFPDSPVQGQTTLFQQQNSTMNHYRNSAEPFQENKRIQQKRRPSTMLPHMPVLQEKQLFYQQTLRKPDLRQELTAPECSQDEDSEQAEQEKETEQDVNELPVYQPFTESFRSMTIRDLIDQCQDHVCVINTCNVLQNIVTEELMKQVKLDDIVYQKLTARAQRLQQQIVFLEKVVAPSWVKAALDDLITRATQRAQAHKAHAASLLKECETIQCSMDETQEAVKKIAAAASGNQEAKYDEVSRNETSLNSMQTSKTSDIKDLEDKLQCKSFLQLNETFEGIRKPWLKLLSLLEYQQEQYDATLTQIEQVENEIEKLLSNEEAESSLWRTQIKIKDLETRKELLEARREHLEIDVSSAKKDIGDFELNNRDNILAVLNALRQQRNRCDSILRDNFELLKIASLRDPTCLRQHINKSYPGADAGEVCHTKQAPVAGKPRDSRSYANSSKDHQSTLQTCGDSSCVQQASCTSPIKPVNDVCPTRKIAELEIENSSDIISESPVRDFKLGWFQNRNHFYSYALMSANESGLGMKAKMHVISPFESIKGRYVHTKHVYGSDGYKSSSFDFNVSSANKDSPVSTADEAVIEDGIEESASPICNDDSKTTSWSMSSSPAEQQCHTPFRSSAFAADNTEKTLQLAKNDHREQHYTVHPSVYQDICGREYNSHRFPAGVAEQSPVDVYDNDLPSDMRCYRTGILASDPLSNKEVRAAYFINKYAGGKQSDKSFLLKSVNGVRSLAWRNTKDVSVNKLGHGYQGNGSKSNTDKLVKRGCNKRKNDDKTENKCSVDDLEVAESSSCQDVYSDGSMDEDEQMNTQSTSLEHSE